jgi:hypothetical protein
MSITTMKRMSSVWRMGQLGGMVVR